MVGVYTLFRDTGGSGKPLPPQRGSRCEPAPRLLTPCGGMRCTAKRNLNPVKRGETQSTMGSARSEGSRPTARATDQSETSNLCALFLVLGHCVPGHGLSSC